MQEREPTAAASDFEIHYSVSCKQLRTSVLKGSMIYARVAVGCGDDIPLPFHTATSSTISFDFLSGHAPFVCRELFPVTRCCHRECTNP